MESPDREVPLYLNTEVSLVWRVQIERFHCSSILRHRKSVPTREVFLIFQGVKYHIFQLHWDINKVARVSTLEVPLCIIGENHPSIQLWPES